MDVVVGGRDGNPFVWRGNGARILDVMLQDTCTNDIMREWGARVIFDQYYISGHFWVGVIMVEVMS